MSSFEPRLELLHIWSSYCKTSNPVKNIHKLTKTPEKLLPKQTQAPTFPSSIASPTATSTPPKPTNSSTTPSDPSSNKTTTYPAKTSPSLTTLYRSTPLPHASKHTTNTTTHPSSHLSQPTNQQKRDAQHGSTSRSADRDIAPPSWKSRVRRPMGKRKRHCVHCLSIVCSEMR
jgi:hypothetical protein